MWIQSSGMARSGESSARRAERASWKSGSVRMRPLWPKSRVPGLKRIVRTVQVGFFSAVSITASKASTRMVRVGIVGSYFGGMSSPSRGKNLGALAPVAMLRMRGRMSGGRTLRPSGEQAARAGWRKNWVRISVASIGQAIGAVGVEMIIKNGDGWRLLIVRARTRGRPCGREQGVGGGEVRHVFKRRGIGLDY